MAKTETEPREKDPAAVALGRRGGLKGGPARMAKMTAAQRSAMARKGGKAFARKMAALRNEKSRKLAEAKAQVETPGDSGNSGMAD